LKNSRVFVQSLIVVNDSAEDSVVHRPGKELQQNFNQKREPETVFTAEGGTPLAEFSEL